MKKSLLNCAHVRKRHLLKTRHWEDIKTSFAKALSQMSTQKRTLNFHRKGFNKNTNKPAWSLKHLATYFLKQFPRDNVKLWYIELGTSSSTYVSNNKENARLKYLLGSREASLPGIYIRKYCTLYMFKLTLTWSSAFLSRIWSHSS